MEQEEKIFVFVISTSVDVQALSPFPARNFSANSAGLLKIVGSYFRSEILKDGANLIIYGTGLLRQNCLAKESRLLYYKKKLDY